MKVKDPESRLDSVWGVIESTHHHYVIESIHGRKVLDIGCGYGSMVNALNQAGFDALGIDPDPDSIERASKRYPASKYVCRSAESDLSDLGNFDTVVCKDSFHHLVGEADINTALPRIASVLAPGGRLVVVDPNPCFLLRLCRRVVGHIDVEVTPSECSSLLEQHGFSVSRIIYFETIGIALSGGFVGPELVPSWGWTKAMLKATNELLTSMVRFVGIDRFICWRYLCVANLGDARVGAADFVGK